MGALLDLIKERALWVIIGLGLLAGLVASYGRERHEGRRPDGNWWFIRFLAMPFLAIVASAGIDQFKLNPQKSALLSALLSLLGYEVVRIFYVRGAKATDDLVGVAGETIVATAKPYFSKVEPTPEGAVVAKIEPIEDPDNPRKTAVGRALRETYPLIDSVSDDDLLSQLDRKTRGRTDDDRDDGKDPTLHPRG